MLREFTSEALECIPRQKERKELWTRAFFVVCRGRNERGSVGRPRVGYSELLQWILGHRSYP